MIVMSCLCSRWVFEDLHLYGSDIYLRSTVMHDLYERITSMANMVIVRQFRIIRILVLRELEHGHTKVTSVLF
jgi:hypothetical protein